MRECGVGQRKKIIIRTADRAANRRSDKKRLQLARSRTTLAGERETRHPNQEANATGPVPSVNTKATKNEIENSQELSDLHAICHEIHAFRETTFSPP